MVFLSKLRFSRKPRRELSKLELKEERAAYFFIAPWLIGVVIFLIIPIVASVGISMTNWSLIAPPKWVGLENYQEMFQDRDFLHSMGVTLKYLIISVPVFMVAGLAIALLLNQRVKGMYVFRTIFYIPSLLSGVAVAVLWSVLLNPDLGVVNQALRFIGIADPPRWLQSPDWAVPSVILMGLWGIGGGAIIYLAGLQNIPPTLYEAAEIDGANDWQKLCKITLPLLTPTIFFTLITSLVGAFQVFDAAYILSRAQGRRSRALLFYLLNLYNEGFRNGRFGYASALAWILVIFAGIAIFLTFRTSERWVYYETEDGKE